MLVSGRRGMRQSLKETMPISRLEYGPVYFTKQIALDIPVAEKHELRSVEWRDYSERELGYEVFLILGRSRK